MSPLNDEAHRNMPGMVVTLDTSHLEISPLKSFALENRLLMSVTRDTSHSPMGPCRPVERSPFGDSFKHLSTALLSSALDCGENAGVTGVSVSAALDCGENAGTRGRACAKFKILGQVQRNDGSVRFKVFVFGRVRVGARLGIYICARTIARIRRHADKKHKEQDQNIRRQTNLCILVDCSTSICVCVCSRVYLCV